MEIKIKKGCIVDGKSCAVGDIVRTSTLTADLLVNIGKAEPYTAPAKPEKKKSKK